MMSRIMKFRCWDKKDKQMYKVGTIDFNHPEKGTVTVCYYTETGSAVSYAAKGEDNSNLTQPNLILMQFTGLKDYKGREIYEGDIVEIKHLKIKGEIIWEFLSWQIKDGGMLSNFQDMEQWKLEIIGNIYESPDLLKLKGKENKEK